MGDGSLLAAALAAALTLAAAPAAVRVDARQPAPSQPCSIRSIANAGVLVGDGPRTLLIDAPIRDGIPPYAAPDAPERERLEQARSPYDRVSAILITHWHADHFSAEAVATHLQHNANAVLVSSDEVVARVRHAWPDMPATRARPTTPAPGRSTLVPLGDWRVHVLRIRHNPARVTPEQHVGFLVEGCRTILHTGDADPVAANFDVLRGLPRIDVALVPFWFLTSGSNRTMTSSAIAPGRALALHVPPNDAAEVSRTLASMSSVVALVKPGQVIDLR
jgi:L-ascorbate metabolism protein UlaG (beta-lactamase superfamily)